MSLDLRDILIVMNILSMIGGAFYLVGMLKAEIRHLTAAVLGLRDWLEKTQVQLNDATKDIAVLSAKMNNRVAGK